MDVCVGFEVHQPYRLDRGFVKEKAEGMQPEELFEVYFDSDWNREILNRVAEQCYLPANEILLQNIEKFEDEDGCFKVAISISGTLVEQLEKYYPEVLDSFKRLAKRENVELLGQTYYHSLASLYSIGRREFLEQVRMHEDCMENSFGCEPKVFENTEFLYNNSIAKTVSGLGYEGVFTEGAERVLGWRSPNYVYQAVGSDIKVFMRNYRLSDDVGFRFSNQDWNEWPLTAGKYAAWLSEAQGQCVNLFMDYETFGEYHWPVSGIHDFLRHLPGEVLARDNLRFANPSELLNHDSVDRVNVKDYDTVSWADENRDTSPWLGNELQRVCYKSLKELERPVKKSGDENLLKIWRLLQVSDHLYYMALEGGSAGEVHGYFSQQTAKEAFRAYSRIVSDFREKVLNYLS
ncbi:hypothetical protein AKJ56_01595 [candidate division MSBL1 archaeon SCGC-AAA382N08]|uniref:Glycoside hydrolase family 57 N-terminal domain-containing protein n=1 Tax=candidate division MSBL1 archaeon SCGC-AAA382N08 TaxID=1698285 RepID=A0A133VP86_9EURY|nr:hypothetical protein AKJ56_01595 [candidate division MSBL1 archaeon SCGC-AAA382N08]